MSNDSKKTGAPELARNTERLAIEARKPAKRRKSPGKIEADEISQLTQEAERRLWDAAMEAYVKVYDDATRDGLDEFDARYSGLQALILIRIAAEAAAAKVVG